jgi:hypothetical protein
VARARGSKATGALYGAFDSGCSCPTPFEDFARLEDMTPIRTVEDAKRLVRENLYDWDAGVVFGNELAFLAQVRGALRMVKTWREPWRGYS